LKIVDYKTDPEEKKKFVDHINNSLEMGPNMKNRFVYGDDRIIFDGVDAIQ